MSRSFISLLLLPICLSACTLFSPPTGQILDGQIFWQGEVRIHGDLVFERGSELIIAPGTRVIFEPPHQGEDLYREHPYFVGSELIVRGRLQALGTATEPISFMAADSTGKAGSWGGINIEDSPAAQFTFCRFEQADSAIHARHSQVKVESSIFRHNYVGVRFHDTSILIENNLFENNGTAIRFHLGAPVIRHNLIRHNGKGLFISSEPKDYLIVENQFWANRPYQVSLGEGVRQAVDLRHNAWSEPAGSALEALFYDGRIDDWLGRIEYRPLSREALDQERLK